MSRALALPTTDPRAHALRAQFHAAYDAADVPVPVESIAADLLGLYVEQADIDCSGLPGSGKTYRGAQMIVALIEAGKRMGSRHRATRRSTTCSMRSRPALGRRGCLHRLQVGRYEV
jgi:hypothetical protein